MKNLFIVAFIFGFVVSCGTENNPLNSDNEARDKTTQVVEVQNPVTGRIWMDRNLGASRAATSPTDSEAYGDLYQWGRRADGHQKRNSPTTENVSFTDTPSHGSFILLPNDWRSVPNNNLWQGKDGINNPCPVGYRIPTFAEWTTERDSWSNNYSAVSFSSILKLPLAGYRSENSGSVFQVGTGYYWSSSANGDESWYLVFSNSYGFFNDSRSVGKSVRCIKD